VKGNHDIQNNDFYRCAGFKEVYDKPVILENFWILSHEPLYVCENMPYAKIFGHVHNSPLYKDCSSHHFCVTVERINYTPISFDEIKRKVNYKK
jgi:calcineurin-like phosphoesterase family protein